MLTPERMCIMLKWGKVSENSGEGSSRYLRANRSLCLEKGAKANRTISQLVPSNVSLRITGAQQLYQVKRMIRGIGDVPCSTSSRTEKG